MTFGTPAAFVGLCGAPRAHAEILAPGIGYWKDVSAIDDDSTPAGA